MHLFPDVARKIHEEVVAVTGGDRLPTIADRPALPYTEAVWKESLRWNTFSPLVSRNDPITRDPLTITVLGNPSS